MLQKVRWLFFSNSQSAHVRPLSFMGGNIKIVNNDKHLGLVFGCNAESEKVNTLCREITCKTNMIRSHFQYLSVNVLYFLFKTYAMPLYGAQTVALDGREIDRLKVAWRKAVRFLLRLPYRTHSNLLHVICDDYPIHVQLCKRFAIFFMQCLNSPNSIVRLCAMLALGGSASYASSNLSFLSFFY